MLRELEDVLPALRSRRVSGGRRIDWNYVEREVGTKFPTDFVDLCEAYPPFVLGDFLSVHIPKVGGERNFVSGIRRMLGALACLRGDGMSHGYVPFPETGRLVPWGDSCDGDDFYWRTGGNNPDEWTILISGRNDDWCEYQGTLAQYLAGLVSGAVPPDGLPPDFPGDSPTVDFD